MNEKALELHDVTFSYGAEIAVRSVSFSIDRGDFLGIIGPNGGGKSTLLKLILGMLKPQSGSVRLMGDDPVKTRIAAGYVPQETSSNKGFPISVLDAVRMGLTARRGIGRPLQRRTNNAPGRSSKSSASAPYPTVLSANSQAVSARKCFLPGRLWQNRPFSF
jgi:zinc transport system ATP-binding protein